MYLLDVNVLIALLDSDHVHFRRASLWFERIRGEVWATCPITENGVIRILGGPVYRSGPGSTRLARDLLSGLTRQPGHQFWPDDLSLLDRKLVASLPESRQITDAYLLALAVQRKARLATLDERIDPMLISGGRKAYGLIPA